MLSSLDLLIIMFVAESSGCIKQALFKLGPDICLLLLNILQSITKSRLRLEWDFFTGIMLVHSLQGLNKNNTSDNTNTVHRAPLSLNIGSLKTERKEEKLIVVCEVCRTLW